MKPYLTQGAIYRAEAVRYDREDGNTLVTIHDDSGTPWDFQVAAGQTIRPGWGVSIVNGWAELRAAEDTPARPVTRPDLKRPAAKVRQVMIDDTPDRPSNAPGTTPLDGMSALMGTGVCALVLGLLLIIGGWIVDGTVPITPDADSIQVNNIGLLGTKISLIITGGVLSICGTLLCVAGRKK